MERLAAIRRTLEGAFRPETSERSSFGCNPSAVDRQHGHVSGGRSESLRAVMSVGQTPYKASLFAGT